MSRGAENMGFHHPVFNMPFGAIVGVIKIAGSVMIGRTAHFSIIGMFKVGTGFNMG